MNSNSNAYPFYFTWVKQQNPLHFHIKSVDGPRVYTQEGTDLIDMSSISYQANFGHNHPAIVNAMKKQLDTIPMSAPRGIYPQKCEQTKRLLNYMQKDDGKIFYATGGAETVENALKIARDITKKPIILARHISYHGATLGALAATGDWRNQAHQIPDNWVVRIPEPSEKDSLLTIENTIKSVGPENIAAIILETITGGNGVFEATKEWWIGVNQLCKKNNILLIMDEVICGFERTGKPFGYMHYETSPDIICLAKGITGGMVPFGALWTTQKIADYYLDKVFACGLTNYAHPLGLAAMTGVLDIVESKEFQKNLTLICEVFSEELNKFKNELSIIDEIRSIGMLAGVDINQDIEWKKFYTNGIHLATQNKRIVLAPPLIISPEDLLVGLNRFKKTLLEHK